jgi:hypothetical protein
LLLGTANGTRRSSPARRADTCLCRRVKHGATFEAGVESNVEVDGASHQSPDYAVA